jgi:hypothetical protein
MVVGIAQALPQVIEAFRGGGGVPYEAYGADVRAGIARLNRPMFVNQLAAEWIPAGRDLLGGLDRGPAHRGRALLVEEVGPAACVRRKVRQLVSTSRGAGPILPAARIRRMVPAPTR